jgi:hypothetical protein
MGAARAECVEAMTFIDGERLRTLSYFIRSQANLTDKNPPQLGPGSVQLNHEEALLCADALDAEIRYREGLELAKRSKAQLLNWAMDEWMDASEDVAMGGGTGTDALNRLAADPHLQKACHAVDNWSAICAMLREKIEPPP